MPGPEECFESKQALNARFRESNRNISPIEKDYHTNLKECKNDILFIAYNACIESFHSVLKKEEIYLHTYQDSKEARRAIFEYIEGWYNRKRIHSAIGYMTPQQKEDEELKKAA